MSMDPDNTQHTEFEKRLDRIVAEMRALNIGSITIVQDSVVVGMGDNPLPNVSELFSKEEKKYHASEYDKCFGTAPRSDEG